MTFLLCWCAPRARASQQFTFRASPAAPNSTRMASDKELADFLAGVERRAFKHVAYAVRDDDAALDVVQDAMIKLAEKYGERPAAELPLLFQRILQNATNDFFRRQKVRNTWVSLFSSLGNGDDDEFDVLETYEASDNATAAENSAERLEREQVLALIDEEIQKLPARQREAFLMRYWEDMDVAETAAAMGCSEGSVKTHCSRATHALAAALKAKGITL
ncbi:Specialized sigma subunits of RNA polymerase [Mycetohabitans rhizoxinica HKI 454]|uniref:Specialized sigma subunits of RNA polymerase n=2 Tax=Mycetohabitans rhizoxinica TaxID=412963 RepID=E5ASW3_MYCRK|nr:Specialized sigma subunits of RNA polymerase [Mycetohabitans rhizoxinica HKI 454]